MSETKELSYEGTAVFTMRHEDLGEFWPVAVKFLMMIDEPDWTIDEVFESIKDKKAQVWGVARDGEIKGIWITRIEKRRDVVGLVWIAAGHGIDRGIPLFLGSTEDWFKQLGCKYVSIFGRRGWVRVLAEHGYAEQSVEVRKYL